MSEFFDPLREWLSIDCPGGNPTHYELLKIAPHEKDMKRVEAAARDQLKRLNQIADPEREELLQAWKNKVKKAFAVISQPAQRAKYDQQLAKSTKSNRAAQADLIPPANATSKSVVNPTTSPPKSNPVSPERKPGDPSKGRLAEDFLPPQKVAASDLLPPGSELPDRESVPSDQFDPPKARTLAMDMNPPDSDTVVPIAKASHSTVSSEIVAVPAEEIPVAAVVDSPESSSEPVVARVIKPASNSTAEQVSAFASSAAASSPITSEFEPGADSPAMSQGGLSVQENSASSGSYKTLVLYGIACLFSLCAVGGLIYWLGMFQSPIAKNDSETEVREPASVSPNSEQNNREARQIADRASEASSIPVEGEGKVESGKNAENTEIFVAPTKQADSSDVDNNEVREGDELGDRNVSAGIQKSAEQLLQGIFELDSVTQLAIKHRLYTIQNDWLKQNYTSANAAADKLPEFEGAELLSEAIVESSNHLEGFWSQFVTSCKANRGDIEVDGRLVGFVEAAPDHLTLKIAGSNRRYDYRFVPPGLMLAIIDKNAIEDIPTYRLQKTAYLMTQLRSRPDLAVDILELLQMSELDGHDVSRLRMLAQFPYWQLGAKTGRVEMTLRKLDFSDLVLDAGLKESELKSSEQSLVAAANAFQKIFEFKEFGESEIGRIELVRRLAVTGGDGMLAKNCVELLEHYVENVDADLLYQSLLSAERGTRSDENLAEWYCHVTLEYLRGDGEGLPKFKFKKLASAGLRAAKRLERNAFAVQFQGILDRE